MPKFILLILFFLNIAFAHSGYNQVFTEKAMGVYHVSVFEDTHLLDGQPHLAVFIQVTENRQAPPDNLRLELSLQQNETLIRKEAQPLGITSNDGKTIYNAYLLELPLPQTGNYNAHLKLQSEIKHFGHTFVLNTEPRAAPRASEFIPSLIIIFIVLAGFSLIFFSPQSMKRKDLTHAKTTQFGHL